jgi:hypothetical protein
MLDRQWRPVDKAVCGPGSGLVSTRETDYRPADRDGAAQRSLCNDRADCRQPPLTRIATRRWRSPPPAVCSVWLYRWLYSPRADAPEKRKVGGSTPPLLTGFDRCFPRSRAQASDHATCQRVCRVMPLQTLVARLVLQVGCTARSEIGAGRAPCGSLRCYCCDRGGVVGPALSASVAGLPAGSAWRCTSFQSPFSRR